MRLETATGGVQAMRMRYPVPRLATLLLVNILFVYLSNLKIRYIINPNPFPGEACDWRPGQTQSTNSSSDVSVSPLMYSYSTCSPHLHTCPDNVCDALETLDPSLCPQVTRYSLPPSHTWSSCSESLTHHDTHGHHALCHSLIMTHMVIMLCVTHS